MCIICVSKKGVPLPTTEQLTNMFINNPHGAGYMVARGDNVEIHKGFMTLKSFMDDLEDANLSEEDTIVYHFRISTQAGVTNKMTHPFPLTRKLTDCEKLDLFCPCGVAHNGIIRLTSDYSDKRYNDTAHFITEYMSYFIREKNDIIDETVLTAIETLTASKWAILFRDGTISTVGNFIKEKNGLLFSNSTYQNLHWRV